MSATATTTALHPATGALRVRRGIVADAPALAALGAATFTDTYGAYNTPEHLQQHLERTYGEPQQRRELEDPATTTLVAHLDGRLVGFAQLVRSELPACVEATAAVEILRFYLDTSVHGQGVARPLMEAAYAAALDAGATHVWLGVWERNPRAIAFYLKCGFAHVGMKHFHVGDDRQDDHVMLRALPQAMG